MRELRERLGESRGDLLAARERDGRRAAALVDLRDRQLAITEELAAAAENEEAARVAINALVSRAERAERRAADAELRVAEALRRQSRLACDEGDEDDFGSRRDAATETETETETETDGDALAMTTSNANASYGRVMDFVTRAAEDAAQALNEKSRERAARAASAAIEKDALRRLE